MRVINLTNSYDFVLIDDEDYEHLSKLKFLLKISKKGRGIYRKKNFNNTYETVSVAHEVMKSSHMFDHIDQNVFNNQKTNLRPCTASQNLMNRPKYRGISKYKGVTWHNQQNKWVAKTNKERKLIFIGCFKTQEEAALAYNEKVKELYGEFAVLNVIQ